MRFLLSGLSLNLVLFGAIQPHLAVAAPVVSATSPQLHSLQLTPDLDAVDEGKLIRGNGVEFVAPAGFKGGSPSEAQVKTLVRETAKVLPSMASFVQLLDNNPDALRALAIDSDKSQGSAVLVQKLPITADISLEALHQSMVEIMPKMLPAEVKLVGSRIVKIGSRNIVKMELEFDIQGLKLNESMGLIKEGNDVYQVVYAFAPQIAPQASTNFERMIRTFKVTPVTPSTSPML